MHILLKLARAGLVVGAGLSAAAAITVLGAYLYFAPGLPQVSALKDIHLQVPLRVYTRDGRLLAEYGRKRRQPLSYDEVPALMRKAFLAAEDDRFFAHPGVDYQGLARAAWHLLRTGEKGQGGSTITMQLARNVFLTSERTYTRKLREIFLALTMERLLSKPEILQLYLNKIYLGNRAYGIGAAAQVYYGLQPSGLSLAQIAMIAGLPKAPSAYNPIASPARARQRRDYVLGRMRELAIIGEQAYDNASHAPISARVHSPVVPIEAAYVGEMVRSELVRHFGEQAYTRGYKVYTSVDTRLQRAATEALRDGLLAYDVRHGYRGPEARVDPERLDERVALDQALADYGPIAGLKPGVVTQVEQRSAQVYLGDDRAVAVDWPGLAWARAYRDEDALGPKPEVAADVLEPGDIVRVTANDEGDWLLRQVPALEGALVSLDPTNGDILALTGGFDFYASQFNRATQAERQPGSAFKPFIYSAALANGFTPASIINDAPVVFNDAALEDTWRPENYSGKFHGPTRVRQALIKSRNLVSIRLLNSIGKRRALDHIARFGFDESRLPYDLSLALGSGSVTPLELARGYAVFANGGYRVRPHVINRIETVEGERVFEASPPVVCDRPCQEARLQASEAASAGGAPAAADAGDAAGQESAPQPAERVLPGDNAYQMVSMMQDVIRHGTGRKARRLERSDIAGKTGTTNDQRDAWFSGYNADVVATVWVGFDNNRKLGRREVGGVAALPVWIDYMRVALKDRPEHSMPQPDGMVTVRIDPQTGLLANAGADGGIFETFRAGHVPTRAANRSSEASKNRSGRDRGRIPEHLF